MFEREAEPECPCCGALIDTSNMSDGEEIKCFNCGEILECTNDGMLISITGVM